MPCFRRAARRNCAMAENAHAQRQLRRTRHLHFHRLTEEGVHHISAARLEGETFVQVRDEGG